MLWGEGSLLVELLEGHRLGRDGGHRAGRHDVGGLDVVEFDDVLDDFVLAFLERAFLFAHIGHRGDLLATDLRVRLVLLTEEPGDELYEALGYRETSSGGLAKYYPIEKK